MVKYIIGYPRLTIMFLLSLSTMGKLTTVSPIGIEQVSVNQYTAYRF